MAGVMDALPFLSTGIDRPSTHPPSDDGGGPKR